MYKATFNSLFGLIHIEIYTIGLAFDISIMDTKASVAMTQRLSV